MKILKFNDYSNIEYRKGSLMYGGLITKLMEFLRIYKNDNSELVFSIKDFQDKSNINIKDIQKLINDKNKNNLINFNIEFKDDKIIFNNLTKDKSRFFESFNESIRGEYELYGVDDFYKIIGNNYKNPHFEDIKKCLQIIDDKNIVDFTSVLDLGSGLGEVTKILYDIGYKNVIGCDPYLYKEYEENTGNRCLKYSFVDISNGYIDNLNFNTIISSYSLHLSNPSIIPNLMWVLSLTSQYLIILSPNNKPYIKENNGWVMIDEFKIGKCKSRIFKSSNF